MSREMSFKYLPERLKCAREQAGLTQEKTAAETGIGISSISEFESGKREPRFHQLSLLAGAYKRDLSFFLSDEPIEREPVVLWRQMPENSKEMEGRFIKLCRQYRNLEVWCAEAGTASLPVDHGEPGRYGYNDAKDLAARIRKELELGEQPGSELLRVLEERCGVKVFHESFRPTGPAASTKDAGFGYAILLNSLNVRWRRNFDLAHELFHLLTWDIFHSDESQNSLIATGDEEKFATCFARHLLMPIDALRAALKIRAHDKKVRPEHLFDIARLFDVSIEALLWQIVLEYKLKLSEEEIRQFADRAESQGKREDTRPPEYPDRYNALAVRALREGRISIGRFAEYLGISRQKAMAYMEQEADDEEIELPV
jgi:Zn-dependent peptidase ImmA (M78 family)/transcriptional regulator with XRE-family HTH domain